MNNLLPGYCFYPHDHDLLLFYLHHKIYHGVNIIKDFRDVDLYKCDPQFLTEKYRPVGDREWYFFSPRYRKYRNSRRPNRCVSTGGFWKAVAVDTEVKHKGKIIGFKKILSFHYGKPKDGAVKTKWMMHEFVANFGPATHANDPNVLDEWVLYRLYENEKKVQEELIDLRAGKNVSLPQYYISGNDLSLDSPPPSLSLDPLPPSLSDHQYSYWDISSNNINLQNIYDDVPPSLDLDFDLPGSDCPSDTTSHWSTITHDDHANRINLDGGVWGTEEHENCDNSEASTLNQIYQTSVDDEDIFTPEFYSGSGSMMVGEDLINDFPYNTPCWSYTDDIGFPTF